MIKDFPSVFVLVAANLIPLYGVVFLGWDIFPLLFLYWFENLLIGFLNIARMLVLKPKDIGAWLGKIFIVPFFTVHYGMFTMVHGVFVIGFFGQDHMQTNNNDFPTPNIIFDIVEQFHLEIAILAIFLSHVFSFAHNYIGKKEYQKTTLETLMGHPYGRVIVLHFVILIGAFLAMAFNSHIFSLIILVILKIIFDVKAHLAEHGNDPKTGMKLLMSQFQRRF